MTDWKSPAVIAAEYFALVKLFHAIWGVLLWEFIVNIGFEYSVFTGKRSFRSSFFLYLGARWCPLFCVITILIGLNSANRINCQAIVTSVFLFSHLALACASALIVLRIAAVWGLNKIAISIASAAWLAYTGCLIHGTVIIRATWSGGICKITNTSETKINVIVSFANDLVLLALMLTGLLRWETAHQRGGIWWLLFIQGLAWMIIVIVADAPVTVLILLNRNGPMNVVYQTPARYVSHPWRTVEFAHSFHSLVITLTIGASRVYRGLSDYVHNEAKAHMSGGLPVRQPLVGYLPAPRSGRRSSH